MQKDSLRRILQDSFTSQNDDSLIAERNLDLVYRLDWGPRLLDHWDKTRHYSIGKSVNSHLIPRLVAYVHHLRGVTGQAARRLVNPGQSEVELAGLPMSSDLMFSLFGSLCAPLERGYWTGCPCVPVD